MSDSVRSLLADTLRKHFDSYCDPCIDIIVTGRFDGLADHLADVLLALPGIAIVDTDADIEWVADQMAKADDIIYGLLTSDEAEYYQRLARAALAAARVVQEEQP
jgi:hypothetical protein